MNYFYWWISMFSKPCGNWTIVDGFLFSLPLTIIMIIIIIYPNKKLKHNYFYKSFQIGILYFSIFWLHNKIDITFSLTTNNW